MTIHHSEDIVQSSMYLSRIFDDSELQSSGSFDELRTRISEKIVYLLLHHMEGLLQLLYRIDVDERKVKECFALNDPREIAPALAELIIARELKKAAYRKSQQ